MKTLMLIALPLVLGACSASTPSVEELNIQRAPASLLQPCPRPVNLPNRELSQSEVEDFWLVDRRNLLNCRSRHAGLVNEHNATLDVVLGQNVGLPR